MRHLKDIRDWTKDGFLFPLTALLVASPGAFALTTTLTAVTPPAALHNSPDIRFEFTSDAVDVHFVCALDDEDPQVCVSPKSYQNIPDGLHRFRVHAISESQGPDYAGARHEWRVDTRPPVTSLHAHPAGETAMDFELNSDEPNSTFLCQLNSGPLQPCTDRVHLVGLAPGPHVFRAFAVDEATNQDPIGATHSFTLVVRPPVNTTITAVEPNALYTKQTGIQFHFVSNHLDATFSCSIGTAPVPCTSPTNYSQLQDGTYTFTVYAADIYGQRDTVGAQHTWTVDTAPPVGQYVVTESTSTTATISWTTNEPATSRLEWGPSGQFNRTVPDDGVYKTRHTVRITGLSSATPYNFKASGDDRAGNAHTMSIVQLTTKR